MCNHYTTKNSVINLSLRVSAHSDKAIPIRKVVAQTYRLNVLQSDKCGYKICGSHATIVQIAENSYRILIGPMHANTMYRDRVSVFV